LADLGATGVASPDGTIPGVASDDTAASDGANVGGLIVPEDDDHKRVADGGNSSSEGPDESLRNFWLF
jgi:hypothetical protein